MARVRMSDRHREIFALVSASIKLGTAIVVRIATIATAISSSIMAYPLGIITHGPLSYRSIIIKSYYIALHPTDPHKSVRRKSRSACLTIFARTSATLFWQETVCALSALYQLVTTFNGFYENCPVLHSEGETKASRLTLWDATARTMDKGLELLGIPRLEQM